MVWSANNLVGVFVLCVISFATRAQSPCINGYAGSFPCENIDLLFHLTPADISNASTNEIWGWTDPTTGHEFVLLGASTGVYFFDIVDPLNPVEVGFLPTHTFNSLWRTMRTYQNYLFVCSEASNHGMQVFDLNRLHNVTSAPEQFDEDAHYSGFGSCHTLAISEETGVAYACGTNTFNGGLHIVNIQNPLSPTIAGSYALNGYTHESQIVVYDGPDSDYTGRTIAFCFNGNTSLPVTIVDVTDPTDASTISLSTYPGKSYCHQGWLTNDKGYLLIDDELDEYNNTVDSLHTIIFDVHDLDAPNYMGFHVGGSSIDHNQIVIGNLDYQSNYTNGLSILDVTEIQDTNLHRVAYFDHYPENDSPIFQGEWMSYPYFESGIVAVSDIHNGMFLLKPNFIEAVAPTQGCAGDSIVIQITLKDGFAGPFSLSIDGLPAQVGYSFSLSNSSLATLMTVVINGSNLPEGLLNVDLTVQGLYNHYSSNLSIQVSVPTIFYEDADGDGFGTTDHTQISCELPIGYAAVANDCAPNDPSIYPNAPGTFDEIDNNCNGVIDNDESSFCADLNGDEYITVADVQILVGNLNCTGSNCIADINDDGITDIADLLILIADFAEYCP